MGWASGSDLFDVMWKAVREHVPEAKRVKVCMKIIDAFEGHDWDTQNECFSDKYPEIEEAYRKLHPDEDDDE